MPDYGPRPHISLPTHCAGSVTWVGNHGVVDASDLHGPRRFMHRVYVDACDEGFWLRSPRTGRSILFVLTDTEAEHPEGGVVSWGFTSQASSRRYRAPTPALTLRVFND